MQRVPTGKVFTGNAITQDIERLNWMDRSSARERTIL